MSGAILAVDTGSSSVRAAVCDRAGMDIGGTFTQTAYQFERTPDGGATLELDGVCETVFACIDAALESAGDTQIEQVAVDTFASSLVGVDAAGRPVTPLYTWHDARGAEQVAALKDRLFADEYHQRTGCYVHPSYWPVRLAWLRESAPDSYAGASKWLTLGGYIARRVFGRDAISLSDAAWTGLLNRRALTWDTPTLAALALPPERLPEIETWAFSRMRDEFSARWPALAGATWHPAIGDGVASNIGTGCAGPGQVALSLGTSGALRVIAGGTPDAVPDGLFCYRIDAARSLVGGALSNAGGVYHWLRQTLRFGEGDAALDDALAVMAPDGHGLTILPYLAPERSPYWNADIPAAVVGLTGATTALDIARAGLEGVAYGFARIMTRLAPLLPSGYTITASGGMADASPALLQILADVLGRPILAAPMPEATLRGVVLFHTGSAAENMIAPREYIPNPARAGIYAAAIARQEGLIRLLERLKV